MIANLVFFLALGFFGWLSYFIAGKLCYALKKNNYKNVGMVQGLTTVVIFVLLVFIALLALISAVGVGC